ncbi:MAG: lysyl-tRNA synthetase, class [Candidatus Dependentiae bacterium]|nr:lysyl-tRNA synthetase, class [Candidatus Dependentiae bacterium]
MSIKEKDVSTEHEVRVQKIDQLATRGVSAWPEYRPVSATTQQLHDAFGATNDEATVHTLAGRVMTKRGHGKTVFAHLQDRAGRLQVYVRSDAVSEAAFDLLTHSIDIGDILWVTGTMFTTKTGEPTLKVTDLVLLSKCLHALPEKYHGLTDVEQRYRQRYLDLMVNPESKQKFLQRSRIVQQIRDFLLQNDFVEVETPMLHPIPGGAAARPFKTHHNAYDIDLFLRIAPELYLKRLVVGGIERVFEINRNFRNEGVSTRHNPEFTMLEYYMAHGDYADGMRLTEDMLRAAARAVHGEQAFAFGAHTLDFEKPFLRVTMQESATVIGGIPAADVMPATIEKTLAARGVTGIEKKTFGEKLLILFELAVESRIVQPTFITDFPIEISPLSKRKDDNPAIAARFELFIAGMELANGFSELNDPFDQAERFRHQAHARASGDDEAHFFDADYIKALEYGLPPTVGVGIGIDRLAMFLTGTTSIKDVILFPTMKLLHEVE